MSKLKFYTRQSLNQGSDQRIQRIGEFKGFTRFDWRSTVRAGRGGHHWAGPGRETRSAPLGKLARPTEPCHVDVPGPGGSNTNCDA
jgi:hypothetical protein